MSNNSDSKPKKKERKLTEAEIKRKANFKAKEAALLEKGYKRKDLTVSIAKANFVGVLLTVPFDVANITYNLSHSSSFSGINA